LYLLKGIHIKEGQNKKPLNNDDSLGEETQGAGTNVSSVDFLVMTGLRLEKGW